MKVIEPVVIDRSNLVSSSVPEDDYPDWDPALDYQVGDRVLYQHVVYECVETPNIDHVPDMSPLRWAAKGPSNRWLMFDSEVNSQTEADESIVVTIAPGLVDSLALLNLTGVMVNVRVTDGADGPELYNRNHPLDGSEVFDWFQYFYQPFIEIHQVVLTDLPLYGSAHITAMLTGDGVVKVGSMIAGTAFYLGEMEHGASAGIISFSKKDTNPTTGATTFKKRKNSKRMSGQFMFDNFALNNVYRILAGLDAVPSVWIGTDAAGYEPLTIFGFYRDFSVVIAYPTKSLCSIEIEGLV